MIRRRAALAIALVTLTGCPGAPGWKLKQQDENPRIFAIVDPSRSNLNIRSIVLACEDADGRKSLQLQIYPTNQESILPRGASRDDMKDEPRAEIVIDGRTHPIILAFGGDYALLMDGEEGSMPVLSPKLVEAIERGRTMLVGFDLVREAAGRPAEFDGELEIDLTAGEGGAAIAAVRRACVP